MHTQASLMHTQTVQFIRRGQVVSLGNVAPDRTLLDLLREDLGCTGTKEGCGEGDCGACTVVTGEIEGDGVRFRAVNSCIRLAHSVNGLALWTVEDLASEQGLHPVSAVKLHPRVLTSCTRRVLRSCTRRSEPWCSVTARSAAFARRAL